MDIKCKAEGYVVEDRGNSVIVTNKLYSSSGIGFRFADVDSQFKQGDFDKCRINEQKSEAKNIEESQEVLNGDRK